MNVNTNMAYSKANMEIVKKVRTKLSSEGLLTDSTINNLVSSLERKRADMNFFMFSKKRELDQTISALNFLLENEQF